jgi:serine/threonine-protein kinase
LATNKHALDRFQREVSILKQLDHPNITKYLNSGRWHGAPFYIMEYVKGESLEQIIERRGRIGWEEVVAIGQQLCAALQHAHDKGIIHRDLKPGNLMVLPDGSVKLTDFGIAKDTDVTALTAANSTLGTATYMSPEQCKGVRDLTAKSDLYSMGILFYELLTGRRPFNAETVMEMFLLHTTATFERPSRWVLEIPVWFDTLICELLEKDPERRPENAAAVAKSLAKIREKMSAQTSAGLDAATKRRADRSAHDIRLDETDKDVARTLLGKKKHTTAVPFYRRNWFTLTALGGIAVALLVGGWLAFFKAPDADRLYADVQRLMQSSELDDHKAARSGPIESFLRHHADHPKAAEMARWRDQVDAEVCDHQLHNRRRRGMKADSNAEQTAYDALDDEDAGKLPEAVKRWQELSKYKDQAAQDQRVWGLVADRYLQELKGVDDLHRALTRKLGDEKSSDKKHTGDTKEEQLALAALRDETYDKTGQARTHWQDLKQLAERRPELRRWYLLAAYKARETPK